MNSGADLVVRITANLEELKAKLAEGKGEVEKMAAGLQSAAGSGGALASTFATLRGGLNDVAAGAGVTFGEMGLLGSSMLAVGVGMEAFNFTRWLVGFTGIDDAIAHTTATMMGWGDVSGEAAGAKQDVITRAIERGAAASITYADALKYNAGWFTQWQSDAVKANDAAARLTAPAESAKQIAGWNAELALVKNAGVLASLAADIASHNFSLKELADRYRTSIGAIQEFGRENAAQEKTDAAAAAATDKASAAMKHWADVMSDLTAVGDGWQGTLETLDGSVVEGIKYYLQAGVSQRTLAEAYGATAAQVKAVASELAAETNATKAAAEAATKMAEAQKHWAEMMANLNSVGIDWHATLDTIDGAVVEAIKGYLAAGVSQRDLAELYGLTAVQIKAVATAMGQTTQATEAATAAAQFCGDEAKAMSLAYGAIAIGAVAATDQWVDAMDRLKVATDGAAEAQRKLSGNSMTYDLSTKGGMDYFKKMNPGATVNADPAYFKTHTLQQAVQEGKVDLYAAYHGGQVGGGVPSFASGGVGDFGAGTLAMLHGREAIVPLSSGSSSGAGMGVTNVTVHVNVSGVMDTRTQKELARVVTDEMTKTLRQSRQLPAA